MYDQGEVVCWGKTTVTLRYDSGLMWHMPKEKLTGHVDISGLWASDNPRMEVMVDMLVNTESTNDQFPLTVVYTSDGMGYACSAALFVKTFERVL